MTSIKSSPKRGAKLRRMAKAIYEQSPAWLGPPGSPACPGKVSWDMLNDISWCKRYGYGREYIKSFVQRHRSDAMRKARAALRVVGKP